MEAKPLLGLALLALSAGCGGPRSTVTQARHSPDWVVKGSGAFKDRGAGVFYGVGVYPDVQNPAKQRFGVDERGRQEIARVMRSYVASMTTLYIDATTSRGKTVEDQRVTTQISAFAETFLSPPPPCVEHWTDADGTLYALCRFDLTTLKEAVNDPKEQDNKMREFVRDNAEKAFDELAAEAAKR